MLGDFAFEIYRKLAPSEFPAQQQQKQIKATKYRKASFSKLVQSNLL